MCMRQGELILLVAGFFQEPTTCMLVGLFTRGLCGSIHAYFRTGGGAAKHLNALSRLEGLEKLEEAGRWNSAEDGLFGMPKVRSIKVALKKKKKKKDEEDDK